MVYVFGGGKSLPISKMVYLSNHRIDEWMDGRMDGGLHSFSCSLAAD